jgi:hypothetical protein
MNYYQQIISILKRLKKDHPSYEMGRHISTALYEYNDVWGVSDKEFLFALKKYELELNIDVNHNQEEVDEIMKDGMNLNNILFEEEEE